MYTARFYLFSYYTDKNYTYFFSNISIFLICNNLSGIEQEKMKLILKVFIYKLEILILVQQFVPNI